MTVELAIVGAVIYVVLLNLVISVRIGMYKKKTERLVIENRQLRGERNANTD